MFKISVTNLKSTGFLLIALVLVAILLKFVYLKTAESTYNVEEIPLVSMTLIGGSNALADESTSRLYGTTPITSAISLKLFGFNALGLKFPNIVFAMATFVLLALLCRRIFQGAYRLAWLIPSALLVLGPPVIQVWGMKNRGGFIESIFALVLCLWICASPSKDGVLSTFQKFVIAIVIGLATWSQPIALLWGVVVIGYAVWQDAAYSIRSVPKSLLLVFFGLLIGLMPLIQMNFHFNFNTFHVLDRGEAPGGIDLGRAGRFHEMLVGGIPRLLGLKRQWQDQWVVPAPMAWVLYTVFVFPCILASWRVVANFLRTRKVTITLALVGVAVIVILANIASSWGNFQDEPRRLLLLYVPFAVLTTLGLLRSKVFLITYLTIWCAFNAWANWTYISDHRHGFAHPLYKPLGEVAAFLKQAGVSGVYSDVWTGGRVTFASEGTIPWYRSRYLPTVYGYVGDDRLVPDEAMLFNLHVPGNAEARDRFLKDVEKAGISCANAVVQEIVIVHHCDSGIDFNIASSGMQRDAGIAPDLHPGRVSAAAQQPGVAYLAGGWSSPEPWGVWSGAQAEILRFGTGKLKQDVAYTLTLRGRTYTTPARSIQKIQAFVKGELVAQTVVTYPTTSAVVSFGLKPEWLHDTSLKVMLSTPDAVSPSELGYSPDGRKLAFGLEVIELKEGP